MSQSSQLATRNGVSSEITWTDEQKKLIASVVAPGCNPDELRLFAYHCHRTGLDPFSRQIYAIKRGGKLTIQVSIDGLRAIAERTGELGGSQRFWCGPDGEWKDVWLSDKPPAAAKTIVYRKGCDHPFVGIALFRDYNGGANLWVKMPSVMLGKCSEAQALRAGFPADLSGLYVTEEMDQAGHQNHSVASAEVIPEPVPSPPVKAPDANPAPAAVDKPVDVVELETVKEKPAVKAVEPTEPEATAPVLSDDEKLTAAVHGLSATGKRALLKAYQSVPGFTEVTNIDEFLEAAYQNSSLHLAGLTEKTVAALNEGRHPRTNEQLVSKPGRRPAAPKPEATEEENPFAE